MSNPGYTGHVFKIKTRLHWTCLFLWSYPGYTKLMSHPGYTGHVSNYRHPPDTLDMYLSHTPDTLDMPLSVVTPRLH